MSVKSFKNLAIIVILAAVVTLVFVLKRERPKTPAESGPAREAFSAKQTSTNIESKKEISAGLPKLVDLGAGKCIPCKMMASVLEDLKKTHADKFEVQFIDVWQNPDAGDQHKIRMIPTQIFYDAAGRELFRHEGFYGEEDILAKWAELGVELGENSVVGSQNSE